MSFHILSVRRKPTVIVALAVLIGYLAMFHTRWGLGTQYFLAERFEIHGYSRALVPWMLLHDDLRRSAAYALRQDAIDDLRQAREVLDGIISNTPQASDYRMRGRIHEIWGSYSNALTDYEKALDLRLNLDRNIDVSVQGLSNSIFRVRSFINTTPSPELREER